MSISVYRLLADVVLAGACPFLFSAPSVEHEAAALFGLEYDEAAPGSAIDPVRSACVEVETLPLRVAGEIRSDWQAASVRCGTRPIELLKRRMPRPDGEPVRWRIEDVLLLPALPAGGSRHLAREGECAISDAPGTSFVALIRQRAGRAPHVEQAWRYDLEQGRLQPLPASRLECRQATD